MSEEALKIPFTLVIYSYESGPKLATMQRSVADISAFFGRFQTPYEVLWINPAEDFSAKGAHPSDSLLHLVKIKDPGPKVAALYRAILTARGESIVIADENLSTPLGDLFKILQTVISEKKWAWGERDFNKINTGNSKRLQHDELFSKIVLEKNRAFYKDTFCEIWGFPKSEWTHHFKEISTHKLLSIALAHSLNPSNIVRVKITDSGLSPQHYPQFKNWLSRLFFSIK